jgi:hypothetical protein
LGRGEESGVSNHVDVLNLDILLKGSPILTVGENTEIFDAVHHFITGSRRFT